MNIKQLHFNAPGVFNDTYNILSLYQMIYLMRSTGTRSCSSTSYTLKLSPYYEKLYNLMKSHKEKYPLYYNTNPKVLLKLQNNIENSIIEAFNLKGSSLVKNKEQEIIKQFILYLITALSPDFHKVPKTKDEKNRVEYFIISNIIHILVREYGNDFLCDNIAPLIIILICKLFAATNNKTYTTNKALHSVFQKYLFEELVVLFLSYIPKYIKDNCTAEDIKNFTLYCGDFSIETLNKKHQQTKSLKDRNRWEAYIYTIYPL
nr:hypothetical protein [Oedogonium sp. 269]